MTERRWAVCAHADDEILGLGSLIREHRIARVLYPLPMPVERKREAIGFARAAGYDATFGERGMRAPKGTTLFVHSPSDPHPDHQRALTLALRNCGVEPENIREFAIGGGAPYAEPVSEDLRVWKWGMFSTLFASQVKQVTDPRFFLFEGQAPLGVPSITVTIRAPRMHHYPAAPKQVSFLHHPHRHLFWVRLTLHNLWLADRQVEFLMLQQWLAEQWDTMKVPLSASCEMMGRAIAVEAHKAYGVPAEVSVWEDGENGAKVRV